MGSPSLGFDDGSATLEPVERAAVRRTAYESLARQSIAGVLGHWVLAAVVLSTASVLRSHPTALALVATWVAVVGVERLYAARAFRSMWDSQPRLWSQLFRGGLIVSSATWGIGAGVLLAWTNFDRESWLVLLSVAGISAAGVASLSGDLPLLRTHIVLLLIPVLVAGLAFLPGGGRLVVGYGVVIGAYVLFLWVQSAHSHASFTSALVRAKLLERQAHELDVARRDSIDANGAKSAFLANMSHEIRTPLTAVVGYADLLLDATLGPSERVNIVQVIRRNADHLLSLVNDILDISKIEAGKMTVEQIAVSPRQILAEVASLMRVRATEKKLDFDVEYVGPIPEVIQSDPTRLKQIVLNLVANAIKFTSEGGVRIVVRCDPADSLAPKLTADVVDTGIGLSQEEIGKLFKTFSQADPSTTRRFGGTGLGLVISERLAQLLGGGIHVESAPGRGTLFRVVIPTGSLAGVSMLEGPIATSPGERAPAPIVPSLPSSCRVLVAEDGPDNQVLISTFLTRAGAAVKVVGDGRLAVEEASAAWSAGTPYDVVLMDMQMPVLDGYSATSKLRLTGYKGPIVAITAHAMTGDKERCESAGCDDYVPKPLDRARLIATVARLAGAGHPRSEALVSTLSNDPDMKDIVVDFVRDLPARASAIVRAYEATDLETLQRLAHQLRGAAGGYGFPGITAAAAEVEQAVVQGLDQATLRPPAERLVDLCRRARVE